MQECRTNLAEYLINQKNKFYIEIKERKSIFDQVKESLSKDENEYDF